MNKRIMLSLLLCLALGASLFALPAFADGTVIVIGGAVEQNALPTATNNAAVSSAAVVSGNDGRTVVISSNSSTAASAAASNVKMNGAVVVMPNGQIQQAAAQPVQQAQTQAAAQQGIQTSSAQTAAATTPTVVTPSQNTVSTAAAAEAPNNLAKNILAELNATRAANGLGALRYASELQTAADTRAVESVQNFSHMRPNGTGCETAVTVDYMVTGENLIQVTSEFATAAIMMDTWMNSPTHRNNILLSSFTDVAIGVYVVNGITYVSTVFVGY